MRRPPCRLLPALALLAGLGAAGGAVALEIELVTVGDPGNPGDTEVMNCCLELSGTTGYGSVDSVFRIGQFEVTVAEYTEFLNAVAVESDPNFLWDPNMGEGKADLIRRVDTASGFLYEVIGDEGQKPINHIKFFDAARFANWLHNGQPVGLQGPATTEDGAYTLTGPESPPDVERNPGARFFIPSQDEWYKAAYYDPELGYLDYPTGEDAIPTAEPPPGLAPPAANYCGENNLDKIGDCLPGEAGPGVRTEVGAYFDSPSPWGTFDQGGNHLEWNEAIVVDEQSGEFLGRGFRGGWHQRGFGDLGAFTADFLLPDCCTDDPAISALGGMGFRVAAAPEPGASSSALAALGLLAALARRRR